ncbi:MAG: hypothetical protein HS111_19445 [Kofleriaceae bacterium]|nr:hypothetical protein [Kofleriaceae bacterium]
MAARRILRADHAVVREVVGADAPGLAEHAWAHALTNSRMFKLRIEGTDRRAMVPVAGLLRSRPRRHDLGLRRRRRRPRDHRRPPRGRRRGGLRLGYGQFSNAHLVAH